MEYDLTKLHPDHRKVFETLTPDAYIAQEVIDKMYVAYVELNNIPKRDWNKQSTIEAIQEAVQARVIDENTK